MATKKVKGSGVAPATPSRNNHPGARPAGKPWAIDPLPPAVSTHIEALNRSNLGYVDPSRLADAFEIYESTRPCNYMSPRDAADSFESARNSSKKLREEVARLLRSTTLGQLSSETFGREALEIEQWWAGIRRNLLELERLLSEHSKTAEASVGKANKKPTFEARDRLFTGVFCSVSARLSEEQRIDLAAGILEAAGVAVPSNQAALKRLLRKNHD